MAPVRAPLQIGWIVLGFRIDQTVVDRIGGLTGLDVSIIVTGRDSPRAIATTYDYAAGATSAASLTVPDAIFISVYLIDHPGVSRLSVGAPLVTT